MRRRASTTQRGLTLIEILVALSILALAVLALAPLFTISIRTNASSNQLTNANTLAREKLEELSGYPRNDPRLNVPAPSNAAAPTGVTITGASVGVCDSVPAASPARTYCENDLPKWYQPSTGATSSATTSPGAGWFQFPYVRTYTIEQFDGTLTNRITAPNAYVVKLITVTVRPTQGPFPGLRQTIQSLYLRVKDA
jgi:prepilin-type N-terminal cleavage/methylation domain-containing protein